MTEGPKSTAVGYWAAATAIIGGFLQSYVACIIAGALSFIVDEFHLNPFREGWVASIMLLGALVGSIFSGILADRLGRRVSLQVAAFLFLICGISILFVHSYGLLLFIRWVSGIAAGMASILVPLYLGEIAPASQRGAFVTAFTLSVAAGILIAYLISYFFAPTGNWRLMLALSSIPAGFQFVALFFFPKSPKWLIVQGQFKEGRKSLYQLHGARHHLPSLEAFGLNSKWKDLLSPSIRWVLWIGIALSIFQQLSGINAIIYFTPKIFEKVGFNGHKAALLPTLLLGVINLASTCISMFLIDRFGRRKLFLTSQFGVIVTLGILTMAFATKNIHLDFMAVPALLGFVATYSLGMGPTIWVIIAEIYPLLIRAKAIAVMTFLCWLANYIVVLTFPPFISSTGCAIPFASSALISAGSFFIFLFYLPETKGKTLEELEKILVKKRS